MSMSACMWTKALVLFWCLYVHFKASKRLLRNRSLLHIYNKCKKVLTDVKDSSTMNGWHWCKL